MPGGFKVREVRQLAVDSINTKWARKYYEDIKNAAVCMSKLIENFSFSEVWQRRKGEDVGSEIGPTPTPNLQRKSGTEGEGVGVGSAVDVSPSRDSRQRTVSHPGEVISSADVYSSPVYTVNSSVFSDTVLVNNMNKNDVYSGVNNNNVHVNTVQACYALINIHGLHKRKHDVI